MMRIFEDRDVSWHWIAVGSLTVLVSACLLVHWLLTPAGLLTLLTVVTATSGIALKKKNTQTIACLILMFGTAFVPGFYTAYQKQKTAEALKQVAPAIEKMNQMNQALINPTNMKPTNVNPPDLPQAATASVRPMYLPSPTALKEGWKPPGF